MPTPKIWNNIANRLLPMWRVFAIVSALSFVVILYYVLKSRYDPKILENISLIKIVFISGILYLWAFSFLLIISWFKSIEEQDDIKNKKWLSLKLRARKLSEWPAAVFFDIYYVFTVFITYFLIKFFILS